MDKGYRNDSCEIVRRIVLFKENQAIAADFFKSESHVLNPPLLGLTTHRSQILEYDSFCMGV